MAQNQVHAERFPTVTFSPIDSGLSLAFAYRWQILALAAVVLCVELLCDYLVYSRPLVPKEHFVLWLVYCGGNAWLLTTLQMFFIERIRYRTEPRFLKIATRALIFLPKILLSYGLLMVFFIVYLRFPPFLILLVFFMWAPNFCVGELYVKSDEEEEEELFGEWDDDEESAAFERRKAAFASIFRYRTIWELGFIRSVRFVSHHKPESFQIVLLHWCAEVVPRGVVSLLSTTTTGYVHHALALGLATIADAFVLATAAVVFLLSLPARALEEIDVAIDAEGLEPPIGRSGISVRGSAFRYLVAALLAAIFSWYLFNQAKQEGVPPSSIQVAEKDVHWQGSTIALSVQLQDGERDFRWLEPLNFRLDVIERGAGDKKNEEVQPSAKLLEPRLTSVYNDSGEKLSQFEFKPHYQPLTLILYFDLPEDRRNVRSYKLYYQAPELDLGAPLLVGKLPRR